MRDLAKFDGALDDAVLLHRDTMAAMWTPATTTSGASMPTGLGWFVQNYNGERVYWQFGLTRDAASSLIVSNPHSFKSLPYSPERDFVAVGMVGMSPFMVALNNEVKARNLAELIALGRSSPDKLAFASPGKRLLPGMARQDIIRKSLDGRGALIKTRDLDEACAIANRIAPEHLEVSSNEPSKWEPLLKHAGAIFLGAYTSESLGDYCAGPNHVLPTSGTARFSSPLGVYDFQKRSSLIEVSEAGAQVLGRVASVLAHGEGLQAHAQAAEFRLRRD